MLAAFAGEVAVILVAGFSDDPRPSDVAIVLGSRVEADGSASPRLAARLDKAVELYRQGVFAHVIVSGGVGETGFDEAVTMQRYLRAQGLPEEAILVDSAGANTMATARNAAALLRQHGWKTALVITQYFHIARSALALRASGIAEVHTAHAAYFEWRDIYATLRETVACLAYLPSVAQAWVSYYSRAVGH